MDSIQTNNFEIVDMPGMNTVVFLVERNDNEYRKGNSLFTLSKVEHIDTEDEGKIKKAFSIIPAAAKQFVILLTLTKNKAILSTGEISAEGFKSKENAVPLSYGTIFNNDGIEYKEFNYTPNMKRQFAIIDTGTGEEVKPTLYVDPINSQVKGKCKLLPLRPYIILEIRVDNK